MVDISVNRFYLNGEVLSFKEFCEVVYQNAVEHGLFENGDAGEWDDSVELALIHSEWAEALAEDRAGRPLVWYACGECDKYDPETGEPYICNPKNEHDCTQYPKISECKHRIAKPEGVAVELMDGVLRIISLFKKMDQDIYFDAFEALSTVRRAKHDGFIRSLDLRHLVSRLHYYTAKSASCASGAAVYEWYPLVACIQFVFDWITDTGIDPFILAVKKHQYNASRPYKHGKRY